MMHEIVLGGHLYLQLLKEKLETFLQVTSACLTHNDGLFSVHSKKGWEVKKTKANTFDLR